MIWMQISSGQGPIECSRAVWHIVQMIEQQCNKVQVKLLNCEPDREKQTFKSALLKIDDCADHWRKDWEGTVCWQAPSPFRPHHKRKNWYVKVSFFEPIEETVFDHSQITIEAVKGSGPGGQHVNKSSTAIRLTYLPLNISIFCHEERSQFMNKKLAFARLEQITKDIDRQKLNTLQQESWINHYKLTRGDYVKKITHKL